MAVATDSVLTDSLLERCRERAPVFDRENRFCQEDFDELKAAGYLLMAVPRELGGLGMSLAQVGRETRRLAMYAPATTLCLNMHNYWVGDIADIWRRLASCHSIASSNAVRYENVPAAIASSAISVESVADRRNWSEPVSFFLPPSTRHPSRS